MPIFLLSIILFSQSLLACKLKPDLQFYSLSGPVTLMLTELQLLKYPEIQGVSVFHPVPKTYSGEVLPGGVYLGTKTLNQFTNKIVFYDESQELQRILKSHGSKTVEIKSRGLIPLEVSKVVVEKLKPFTLNCEAEFQKLLQQHELLLQKLKTLIPSSRTFLFFLGNLGIRSPELLIVNDGVVKWLTREGVIKTYPSELAYVNWSPKILQSLPSDHVKVGMKDSGREELKQVSKGKGFYNLTYPGALIPGIGQVNGLIFLFESI